MTSLLPFLILSAAGTAGLAAGCGFGGARLIWFLPLCFLLCFALALLLYVLFLAVITLGVDRSTVRKEPSRFYFAVFEFTLGLLCALCRVRIHLSGMELLPEGRFLLVCNHRSNFDPLLTAYALRGRNLAFVSKPENMKIPVAGALALSCCYLPINRENDREALKTVLAAADYLKRSAGSIGLYPEGTRNRAGQGLLPFRTGAFKIAQRAGVPIVICTVKGTEKISGRAPWRSTTAELNICRVISAADALAMKTAEIGEIVRETMLEEGC